MSVAEQMLRQQVEEANRAGRAVERQMRKFLAGALCCACGEPLGDDADDLIIMDDQDRTIHERCEETEIAE